MGKGQGKGKGKTKTKTNKQMTEKKTVFLVLLLFILLILLTVYWNFEGMEVDETASLGAFKDDNQNQTNVITVVEPKKAETNGKTSDWNLILVNKTHSIPQNYLVNLKEVEYGHSVDERIAEALTNMLTDARKQGLSPVICSSYRTQQKQERLYNDKVNEYIWSGNSKETAKDLASYWVAIPGTGEHQTGLAVDIVSSKYQILDEKQEQTKEQQWLIENSYKYGFILRYPTEKKQITMINYEPWHYRYVGVENALYIKENNICLEEYIEYLKQFEN